MPQKIILQDERETAVDIMFRPDKVYQNHYLCVRCGDEVLSCQKKMILTPELRQAIELLQQRQQKAATLAGSGLGRDQQILSGQQCRDHCLLHIGRR